MTCVSCWNWLCFLSSVNTSQTDNKMNIHGIKQMLLIFAKVKESRDQRNCNDVEENSA